MLRTAPSASASPIVNPSGETKPSDIKALATVTPSLPLRAMCDADNWTRVRVPSQLLRWMEGWVPTSSLKRLALDSEGRRTLTAADIEWQPGSQQDRAVILKAANLILRQDKRCDAIDGRTLLVEGPPSNRRFTLSCDGPAGLHDISFTARDVKNRSFAMAAVDPNAPKPEPIDKLDAASACMDAIRAQLSQPGSADFHTFSDTTFTTEGARARFTVGFSAKNGFGAEIDQVAACVFEGSEIVAADILPTGS